MDIDAGKYIQDFCFSTVTLLLFFVYIFYLYDIQ
jgi:hypothetical protein